MQISENYRIESDTLNVTLYRKQKPRKASTPAGWEAIGYFSTPQNALDYLINHEITGTGLTDFETVCVKIKELERLVRMLKGLPELVQSALRSVKDEKGGKHRANTGTTPADTGGKEKKGILVLKE